ncbi:MAG: FAD-binding protein [Alphaproteobacteria bacterium]|nr:FAD-binding protein [Alphaproteobacteria bacterium]
MSLVDASTLREDLALEADVAIIGTGAGGGTAAEILAQSGLKVVLIEEGQYLRAKDFTLAERQALRDLYQERGGRRTKDGAMIILQGRSVGGSTTVNWTTSFRTPEGTLARWREAHGVKGATAESLAPWFARMEKRLNIHRWTEAEPNPNNAHLLTGAKALGWHADLISRNVKDCLNLGYCGTGCPVNAKQSMLVTTIPGALAAGASLVHRARVEKLVINAGKVEGIEAVALDANAQRPTGPRIKLRARHVVLAAGAIGTPAILMRSQAPDPRKLVGTRTFLHPVTGVLGVMKDEVEGWAGAPQSVYSDEFLWPKDGRIGFKLEVPPLHPMFVSSNMKYFGREHATLMADFPRHHMLIALLRDGFHDQSPGGKVELRKDGSPNLDYPITDYVWEGLKRSLLAMTEAAFAAGATKVGTGHLDAPIFASWAAAKRAIPDLPMKPLRVLVGSAHVMGGCAMGEDPDRSVVNSHGAHHRLANLSVFDGSVFPTSLGVNPQLSIYGLVARNAAALATQLGGTGKA